MAGPPGGDRTETGDCDDCGASISSSMRYCPSCGARLKTPSGERGSDDRQCDRDADHEDEPGTTAGSTRSDAVDRSASDSRSKRDVESTRRSPRTAGQLTDADRQRLERRISTELENGWELEHDFGDHAVLVKRSFGSVGAHLLIALFTIWFTMGVANALYAGYKYFGSVERKVVRPDRAYRTNSQPTTTSAAADTNATATNYSSGPSVKRIFTVGLVWLLGLSLLFTDSLFVSGFGVLLFVTGAAMIPAVRRRVRERDTVTTNGRTRTVTERRVSSPEKPCVVCHRSIDKGIERTYRERFRLLGVSLVTTDEGDNHYCRSCAGLESTTHDRSDDNQQTDSEPMTESVAE